MIIWDLLEYFQMIKNYHKMYMNNLKKLKIHK